MKRRPTLLYRFYVADISNQYHYAELCRAFLTDDEFEIIAMDKPPLQELLPDKSYVIGASVGSDRDANKRELYKLLSKLSGMRLEWGTLTGVRPLKPALDILDECGSLEDMKMLMYERYLLGESKRNLLADIASYQRSHIKDDGPDHISIYIGIPFCPSRCEYCSFSSGVGSGPEIEGYLHNLIKEIEYTGDLYKKTPKHIESIYMGGGTPTTLSATQLGRLIKTLSKAFDISLSETEFTVEAGRPDTIDEDKLHILKELGVSRISINPQSMKDETLALIGRKHNSQDIRNAFKMARNAGFDLINADLIAGLPEESVSDFRSSLDEMISLGAENITVHTLSVKRGSRLHESDPSYYRRDAGRVSDMLDYSAATLRSSGYGPYYVYRQKHQMGAFENVGYCKEGAHSIYNIRIMEDKQSIIAMGAGGVGKLYYQDENRIERVANVSNHIIYSERFADVIKRKDEYFGG